MTKFCPTNFGLDKPFLVKEIKNFAPRKSFAKCKLQKQRLFSTFAKIFLFLWKL